MRAKMIARLSCPTVLLGLFVWVVPLASADQPPRMSASELLAFLTYQSNRPGKTREQMGMFGCGALPENRAAARALVELGPAALPALEQALASIEKSGDRSEFLLNAGWWLTAYAKIEGERSYSRFQQMMNAPKLSFLRPDLETPIAVALGLTSYVSGSWGLGRVFRCRAQQPRDALNLLIVAWQNNDRHWLEASLGPEARSALDALLKNRTWQEASASLWRTGSCGGGAIGYRFPGSGEWSDPEETPQDVPAHRPDGAVDSFTVETRFTNHAGETCGRFSVRFLHAARGTGPAGLKYRVDNPDLGDLLRIIAACGTPPAQSPHPTPHP
jgi:hypothetical protein